MVLNSEHSSRVHEANIELGISTNDEYKNNLLPPPKNSNEIITPDLENNQAFFDNDESSAPTYDFNWQNILCDQENKFYLCSYFSHSSLLIFSIIHLLKHGLLTVQALWFMLIYTFFFFIIFMHKFVAKYCVNIFPNAQREPDYVLTPDNETNQNFFGAELRFTGCTILVITTVFIFLSYPFLINHGLIVTLKNNALENTFGHGYIRHPRSNPFNFGKYLTINPFQDPKFTQTTHKDVVYKILNETQPPEPGDPISGRNCRAWDQKLLLDIYEPKKPLEQGVYFFLHLHGGGWILGDKNNIVFDVDHVLHNGYYVASMQYRLLCFGYSQVDMEKDILDAYYWLIKNYNPIGIIMIGSSAGGSLACRGGYKIQQVIGLNNRIFGIINLYGPTEYYEGGTMPYLPREITVRLYGGENDESKWEPFSCHALITNTSAPQLLTFGLQDNVVNWKHGEILQRYLNQAGIKNYFLKIKYFGHGYERQNLYSFGKQIDSYMIERFAAGVFKT